MKHIIICKYTTEINSNSFTSVLFIYCLFFCGYILKVTAFHLLCIPHYSCSLRHGKGAPSCLYALQFVHDLLYADDTVLIAECLETLQPLLNSVVEKTKRWKMVFLSLNTLSTLDAFGKHHRL